MVAPTERVTCSWRVLENGDEGGIRSSAGLTEHDAIALADSWAIERLDEGWTIFWVAGFRVPGRWWALSYQRGRGEGWDDPHTRRIYVDSD